MRIIALTLIGKVAGMVMLRRNLSQITPVWHQLVSTIAVLLALAMLAVITIALLMSCLLYLGYSLLIATGFSPLIALVAVSGGLLVMLVVLFRLMNHCVEKLDTIPVQLAEARSPFTSQIGEVGSSFLDGLLNRPFYAKKR